MQTTENQLIYLYCVTEQVPKPENLGGPQTQKTPLGALGRLADNVYLVCHRGLYAVANKVKESEFGEEGLKKNMADLEWVKVNASTHEKIMEQVMANADVIPFKFGTLFNTDDSLKAMLEEYGEEFKAILRKLENKEEWGLKIYCDMEKLKATFSNDEPKISKIENEISSSSPGKAYFLKKKKGELIENTLNRKISECSLESFELLKELSFKARINKLLPREVTEREDDMVLNSAFLVEKDEVDDFINMVDTLKPHYEIKGFFFDCTGPWPPYNFCGLSKEKVRSG